MWIASLTHSQSLRPCRNIMYMDLWHALRLFSWNEQTSHQFSINTMSSMNGGDMDSQWSHHGRNANARRIKIVIATATHPETMPNPAARRRRIAVPSRHIYYHIKSMCAGARHTERITQIPLRVDLCVRQRKRNGRKNERMRRRANGTRRFRRVCCCELVASFSRRKSIHTIYIYILNEKVAWK